MASRPSLGRERRSQRMLRTELVDGDGVTHACVIRNISSTGLGGSGCPALKAGMVVDVSLPIIGTVSGRVSWASGDKFGLRFSDMIDPELVRFGAVSAASAAGRFEVMPMHRLVRDAKRPALRPR